MGGSGLGWVVVVVEEEGLGGGASGSPQWHAPDSAISLC